MTATERTALAVSLAAKGLSASEIGREIGLTRQGALRACARAGVVPQRAHHRFHLDPERIGAIRALALAGLTAPEIADKLGTSKAAIYAAGRRHGIKYKPLAVRGRPKVPRLNLRFLRDTVPAWNPTPELWRCQDCCQLTTGGPVCPRCGPLPERRSA